VVTAILIQDGFASLAAEDLDRCNIDPGCFEFPGDRGDLRLLREQAHQVVGGVVIEAIYIERGLIIAAAPGRGLTGPIRQQRSRPFCQAV
jgi:hypothetical protein